MAVPHSPPYPVVIHSKRLPVDGVGERDQDERADGQFKDVTRDAGDGAEVLPSAVHADQASIMVPTQPSILFDRLESEFIKHTFPRASCRAYLLDADGIYPRSVAVGACTKRKRGVTKATAKLHGCVAQP